MIIIINKKEATPSLKIFFYFLFHLFWYSLYNKDCKRFRISKLNPNKTGLFEANFFWEVNLKSEISSRGLEKLRYNFQGKYDL